MVKPSKNRDSRRVEQHILAALQDGKSMPKPAIRASLSLYGQTIVNSTMRQLAMKKSAGRNRYRRVDVKQRYTGDMKC